MTKEITSKLGVLHEEWSSSVAPNSSIDEQIQQRIASAAAIDLKTYQGFILYAGPNSYRGDLGFFVAFQEIKTGEEPATQFVLTWPQWAYEIALQSLL